MEIQGFYTDREWEITNLLIDGEISKTDYFLHHSEKMKEEYTAFCADRNLDRQDTEAAELFWKEQEKEEEYL